MFTISLFQSSYFWLVTYRWLCSDRRTYYMTQWFYFFFFVLCSNLHQKLENLTSYIFSVGLQIPSPALYCHLSPAAARPCMTLFFLTRVMKWFDSDFRISAFKKLASALFFFFFFLSAHLLCSIFSESGGGLQTHSDDMASVSITRLLPHRWNPFW